MIDKLRQISAVKRVERIIAVHFEKLEALDKQIQDLSLRSTQEIEAMEPVLGELIASSTSQSNALVTVLDKLAAIESSLALLAAESRANTEAIQALQDQLPLGSLTRD